MDLGKTIFELSMLICFGISWPFAIARTLKTKSVKGLSKTFYFFVFIGYLSGIIHKILHCLDYVIYFYAINAIMVAFQIILIFFYKNKEKICD